MKFTRILYPAFLILFLAAISILIIFYSGVDFIPVTEGASNWESKNNEAFSRLHSVPILLYHNIDGKGVFSITSERLREHFQFFKEKGYEVVSLTDLMNHLDNPEPYKRKPIVISFDDGFPSMYTKLLPIAKEFGYPITLFVYTDNVYNRATKAMTWAKLKKLDANGIDIQCHTKSHIDLSELSLLNDKKSRRQLFTEIFLSKRVIEKKLGKKIKYFAFPYGRYDLSVIKFSYLSDYERVFSTDYGSNIILRNNFCLRRHHVKSTFSLETIEKIIR